MYAGNKKKLEDKCDSLKKDIEGLEGSLKKAEDDKKQKDNEIKHLNDEMARQDEQLLKTQNAKKLVRSTIHIPGIPKNKPKATILGRGHFQMKTLATI